MQRDSSDLPGRRDGSAEAPILRAEGLSFAYDTTPVVAIDRFEVERASITAVIGHNGCGKTTFFKVASGLLGPYTGRIQFDGIDVNVPRGRQALRRRAVYVHQHPYIFRERVWDNVAFGLKVRGVDPHLRRDRIDRALAAVGLTEFAHRRADGLSGGERQRVAIARALALEPHLIFLDEPTSNIDPTSISLIEQAVVGARAAGTAVLLSTHNLATAYRIADRVVPMEAGRTTANRNNVYHGQIRPSGASVAHFEVPGGAIVVPSRRGDFTAAVVPMEDVFLAHHEFATSAQNRFRGTVTEVQPFAPEPAASTRGDAGEAGRGGELADGGLYRVRLDCGFPLDALVTGESIRGLDIRRGTELYAGFKASAVQLY
ncbi:MAG: ATP-binding cassette domain-containing protein [bacterium]